MQRFIDGDVTVVVHSKDELYQLMILCEEAGLKWASGDGAVEWGPRCVWHTDRLWIYTVLHDGKRCIMYARRHDTILFSRRMCIDFLDLKYDAQPEEGYLPMNMDGLFEA